jgi:hypothetical protein
MSWVMANKPLPHLYVPAAHSYQIPQYYPALPTIPFVPDSGKTKNDTLKFPFTDRYSDPISSQFNNSPLFLGDPSNIKTQVEYDPNSNQYNINEMIGSEFYRNPSYLTYEEYLRKSNSESTKKYWKQLAEGR